MPLKKKTPEKRRGERKEEREEREEKRREEEKKRSGAHTIKAGSIQVVEIEKRGKKWKCDTQRA
jgi:hypothetical protein